MPKRRYAQQEPTHEWHQLRPLLKDAAQITYELIRPVVLFGASVTERAIDTGISRQTIYTKANLFDQAGMASLVSPDSRASGSETGQSHPPTAHPSRDCGFVCRVSGADDERISHYLLRADRPSA